MKTELILLHLKQPESDFLRNLVHFGGACTRAGAELYFPSRNAWSVTRRMKDFVSLGIVESVCFNYLAARPIFYIASRRLARHFGTDRRPVHAIEGLLERQFRFHLSCARRLSTTLANCYTPDVDLPLEDAALDLVKLSRRDEIIDLDNRIVLVDVHPFWPASLALSRLHFWHNVAPHLKLQVWSPSKGYCDMLAAKLPRQLRRQICNFQVASDTITNNYMDALKRREAQSVDCAGHVHVNESTYTSPASHLHTSDLVSSM